MGGMIEGRKHGWISLPAVGEEKARGITDIKQRKVILK